MFDVEAFLSISQVALTSLMSSFCLSIEIRGLSSIQATCDVCFVAKEFYICSLEFFLLLFCLFTFRSYSELLSLYVCL
jgi:hypothetical protein